jgi:hypothetical protein
MGIKDLFGGKSAKTLANKSLNDLTRNVESEDYVEAYEQQRQRFEPAVNLVRPENFAHFGRAEKYFENSIKHIYADYPYDGSLREKIGWHLSASYLDNYIFEHEYPRTNGYAIFSADGWGNVASTVGDYGAPATASYEYVKVLGNMHPDPDETETAKIFPSAGGKANRYDTSKRRSTNLEFDLVTHGSTVEFWLKKDAFATSNTKKEVIFDLWNGEPSSSAGYGRLTIELSGTMQAESPFRVTLRSGSHGGFTNTQIGTSIAGTGSLTSWKHYAFSFLSASSNGITTKFYVNGELNNTVTLGDQGVKEITGSMVAYMGSLQSKPSGTVYGASMAGWGKLSGSIDEFRYWKTQRNSEQIGRYWFDQVGGGTNTDGANTDLGVYYKFNEGITGISSIDNSVLDYSGRVSNGSWTGYGSNSRNTGSAMVLASAADREFKDPIIYDLHPDVSSFLDEKLLLGKEYDYTNNSSIYNSIPGWITEEDEDGHLSHLVQIISSYFDELYLQVEALPKIKSRDPLMDGPSGSFYKPLPFADRLLSSMGLVTPELFSDITDLEQYASRNDKVLFESKLYNIKNTIYTNIYNNLVEIYKAKGTEKGFRNLIRCFGIDDKIIKLNLYSNNQEYVIEDKYQPTGQGERVIDFNDPDRFMAVVSHDVSASFTYVSASLGATGGASSVPPEETGMAITAECEVVFPKKTSTYSPAYFATTFASASIFGAHTADHLRAATDFGFASPDVANFQVFSTRLPTSVERDQAHCKFMLTGSADGFLPELTSSFFHDVYNNEKWNIAVRIYPSKFPYMGSGVTSTTNSEYKINFYGVNARAGVIANEFELTGTLTNAQGLSILRNPKRFFVGAHRQNITGNLNQESDAKVSSFRVWMDFLDNETLKQHALVSENYGTERPYKSAYLFQTHLTGTRVPQIDTLAVHWNFDTVTGSDSSGNFLVDDFSSGSSTSRYSWLSSVTTTQHKARGYEFPASSTDVVDVHYGFDYKKQLPEVLNSDDMVNILERDDEFFTRESRPINHFFAFEKSMYQEISMEIINIFSTVKEFNNLIGEPVNRYRQDYKQIEKLRQLFFERISNTPDLEKFVNFYKWIDDAVSVILTQMVPASANTSNSIRTMVESHVLERNKYWTKFPTLEMKQTEPEGHLLGINELLYNWKFGHAPISKLEKQNCQWWSERAQRNYDVKSQDANAKVDLDREFIRTRVVTQVSGSTYAIRKLTRPHRLNVEETLSLHGGVNVSRNKRSEAFRADTTATVTVSVDSTPGCSDGLNSPTRFGKKIRIPLKATGGFSSQVKSGEAIAPFTVYSSSAGNTGLEIDTNKEITNLHNDGYGDFKERPLQGPFTRKYVGGQQYRHVALNKAVDRVTDDANANYLQPMSTGDRDSATTTTTSPTHEHDQEPYWRTTYFGDSAVRHLIDGNVLRGIYTSGPNSGFLNSSDGGPIWFKIEFSEAIVITEARGDAHQYYNNGGTWQWQGSNNDVTYTDIGDPWVFQDMFTTPLTQTHNDSAVAEATWTQFNANTTAYKYLRCIIVAAPVGSGGSNETVYWWSLEFKIAPAGKKLNTEADRPEGFRLKINTDNTISLMQPEKNSAGTVNRNLPTARYIRDVVAKRPLNLRNIHHTTGSTILGNYDKLYQVIQSSNRKTNNQWWVKYNVATTNSVGDTIPAAEIAFDNDSFLLTPMSSNISHDMARPWSAPSTFISGVIEYTKPVRGRTEHVFVERFSAPGGPETAGDVDGGPGLDALSAEYSVYNTMNYRNMSVRQPLRDLTVQHCGQFGIDSDLGSPSASYHKVYRNPVQRIERDTTGFVTSSKKDNWFIQHQIPRSDAGYAWITASALDIPYEYATDAKKDISDAKVITFLSQSDFGTHQRLSPHGRMFGVRSGSSDARGIDGTFSFTDFAGMNHHIYEPITASDNQLGYPSLVVTNRGGTSVGGKVEVNYMNQNYVSGNYFGTNAGEETYHDHGLEAVLNAIILNRQGPYGWPSWKQIRTGNHPLVRHQRKNNEFQYLQFGRNRTIKRFTAPPVVSKYNPVRHELILDESDTSIVFRYPYGNNISYFSDSRIGNHLNLKNNERQIYDEITDLYVGTDVNSPNNPINSFVSLRYGETIFPRPEYAYLEKTRDKPVYNALTELSWSSIVANRVVSGAADSIGYGTSSYSSLWPLDGRKDFETTNTVLVMDLNQSVNSTGSISIDGAGELLSDRVQFHMGDKTTIRPGPLYARRDVIFEEPPSGDTYMVIGGDAKWEAPSQSGLKPWFDTYEEYADTIKRVGKDYSIIPEFRISDHIEYFVDEQGGNFLADISDNNFLKLEGAVLSSSNQSGFFKEYTHTDFMKYFDIIAGDHEQTTIGSATKIKLKCKAIKKFRPRKGFYPAQRTLQLATLFSKSYGPVTKYRGTDPTFRTMMQPFYAPGILYNTIKSGIAVDYPVFANRIRSQHNKTYFAGFNRFKPENGFLEPHIFATFGDHFITAISSSDVGGATDGSKNGGIFDYRLPFESIVDPASYLTNRKIVDNEVHPSASMICTASIDGVPGLSHKLGISNFLAETINFYLRGSQLNYFVSNNDVDANFGSVEPVNISDDPNEPPAAREYVMDVLLREGLMVATPTIMNDPSTGNPSTISAPSSSLNMYTRPAAFGPAIWAGAITYDTPDYNGFGYAPYTPPYYDGMARARIVFKPQEARKYNLSEIFSNLKIEYSASAILNREFGNVASTLAHRTRNVQRSNAMQISASVILDGLVKNKKAVYGPNGEVTRLEDEPGAGNAWVLQTKFETPVLDFTNVDVAMPLSGSGSVPTGMWHQYGQIPTGSDQGIFLEIRDVDVPGDTLSPEGTAGEPDLTGSLIDLCGFRRASKPIGQLADRRIVKEAVVAIPFVYHASRKTRFGIDRAGIELALDNNGPGSIREMVRKMQNYVFPPQMDFVTNVEIEPFAMYIFEFTHEFTKQDLADMWQNLAPRTALDPDQFDVSESTIEHNLFASSFIGEMPMQDLRWEVFKVKQRAHTDYSQKIVSRNPSLDLVVPSRKKSTKVDVLGRTKGRSVTDSDNTNNAGDQGEIPDYSFNWPYDYFSFVELIKIDAEVEFREGGPTRTFIGSRSDNEVDHGAEDRGGDTNIPERQRQERADEARGRYGQ